MSVSLIVKFINGNHTFFFVKKREFRLKLLEFPKNIITCKVISPKYVWDYFFETTKELIVKNYLKPRKLKKTLLIWTMFAALWGSNAMAVEKGLQEKGVLSADQLCINAMSESLKDVKAAELHFFWTTGRTLSDNEAWGGVRDVMVGGRRYLFSFLYGLQMLLRNSPSHLKVKLVCDKPTMISIQRPLFISHQTYGDRFEILPIEGVQDRLLKAFPDHQEQVNKVFRNATAGNPAIASDIYRLIAMPYSHDSSPEAMTETQYTYCDVDTFAESMRSGHYFNIFGALFKKPAKPVEDFYLGRGRTNNDLIKLSITNVDEYKRFCVSVLENVVKTPQAYLLTMFSDTHESIKEAETLGNFNEERNLLRSRDIIKIAQATGPQFLDGYENVTSTISYQTMGSTLEWHGGTQLLLQTVREGIFSQLYEVTINKEDYREMVFSYYEDLLATALYAKPFGYNHPFNIKIRDQLGGKFPYRQALYKNFDELIQGKPTGHFKDFIKEAYDYQKTNGGIKGTDDEWLEQVFKAITTRRDGRDKMELDCNQDPYYVRLTHLLKQVGVEVPFTVKDIDFRISTSEAHP